MAVFAGMIGVTLFGLFLTPVFYYVVRRLAGGGKPARRRSKVVTMLPILLPLRPRRSRETAA